MASLCSSSFGFTDEMSTNSSMCMCGQSEATHELRDYLITTKPKDLSVKMVSSFLVEMRDEQKGQPICYPNCTMFDYDIDGCNSRPGCKWQYAYWYVDVPPEGETDHCYCRTRTDTSFSCYVTGMLLLLRQAYSIFCARAADGECSKGCMLNGDLLLMTWETTYAAITDVASRGSEHKVLNIKSAGIRIPDCLSRAPH